MPPVVVLTIVLGVIAFLPFHGLKKIGVPDGTIVAGLLSLGVAALVLARKERPRDTDMLLLATPILFYGAHLFIAIGLATQSIPGFLVKLGAIVVVTALAALAHAQAHRLRGGLPQPEAEAAE